MGATDAPLVNILFYWDLDAYDLRARTNGETIILLNSIVDGPRKLRIGTILEKRRTDPRYIVYFRGQYLGKSTTEVAARRRIAKAERIGSP